MLKVFLDANYLIDMYAKRRDIAIEELINNTQYISALSVHILCYILNKKMPDDGIDGFMRDFIVVSLDGGIAFQSLSGPTKDFEDNVQLHSATAAECDIFLTRDKQLLSMTWFGKMKIKEPQRA